MATAVESKPATRNTIQRSLVLDTVRSLHNHPTSAEVYEAVREHHSGISRATVYRNLHLLAERGEIRCVESPVGADCYDYRVEPHYHLICTSCGRIIDADMPVHNGLEREVLDAHGFRITGHAVIIEGLCPDCQS